MTGRLGAIQVLRFLAAFGVVTAHAVSSLPPGSLALGADFLGAMGVSVFFMVSGFIMVHSTAGHFGRTGAASAFLGKRAIRIMPIYWIATAVAAAVLLLGSGRQAGCGRPDAAYLAASVLFVAYPRCDGEVQPLLTQGWTLNYEAFFYLAFAAALLLRRRLGCALLVAALLGLVACGAALRGLGAPPAGVAGFYTDPILAYFVMGMALAFARERWGAVLRVPGGALALTAAALAVLLPIDVLVPYSSDADHSHLLVWVAAPVVTALFALAPDAPGAGRALSLLEALGDASYSIYLTHIFALTIVRHLPSAVRLAAHPLAGVAAGTVAALLLGYAVHRLVERPLVAALRGRARVPRVPVEFQA